MADPTLAIETNQLRKEYGDTVAVRGLTLDVRRGEVFGFLGPNGAGKTTSIKMFLGLAAPTGGEGYLLGKPVGDISARSKVGFLPEHFRFHDWLTGREFLTLHGQLQQIPEPTLRTRTAELLELVGLTPFSESQLRTYSKGMLQRIGLAQALINEPELIFLDEPTSGLDPVGRRLVRDIIHGLRERGATVFLNSHFLSEVEITCDRVAFIKNGEVVRTNELKNLIDGRTTLTVRAGGLTAEMVTSLRQWGQDIRLDGEQVSLVVETDEVLPKITRYLVEEGALVYAVVPQRTSLEELFIETVGTEGVL